MIRRVCSIKNNDITRALSIISKRKINSCSNIIRKNIFINNRNSTLNSIQQRRCLSDYEPVSRKKGKKNDGSDYDFEEVAKAALITIKDAIEPLLALNPTYMLKVEDKSIILATGNKGTYYFEINNERETIRVLSPGSGSFSYAYNYVDKTWLNIKDNHDMRGLITRDLLRHCTGLPLFK